jgi:predicted amidophosphoribosyltransferase
MVELKVLRVPSDLYEALRLVRDRSMPGVSLWRVAAMWPRCPGCGAPLLQKLASHRLVCPLCGKEFELLEVVDDG